MKKVATAASFAVGVSFFAITLLCGFFPTQLLGNDDVADRLFDRAGQAQNNGDFEFAAELWDKFLSDHKNDPQAIKARHYAGVCRMTLKEYDKAVTAFAGVVADKKAETLSQLEESYYYLGWCQFSIGQQSAKNNQSLEEAIATFDKHIAKFEKGKFLDQAYFLKGESLYFLGRKKQSIAAYSKVVSRFKESTSRPNAIYALGVSQFEVKDYADAEATFDIFLDEFKDDALASEVNLFKAESILQRGLALLGDDKSAALELVKQARESLADLAEIKDFPKRDEAIYNQALCESQLGNQKAAAGLYETVATDFATSPFAKAAQLAAGKLYLRVKDYDRAVQSFQKVAANDPANTDEANHWHCQCLLRQNKPAQAVAIANSALKNAQHADFSVRLKMDLADAYYAIPDKKTESIDVYSEIAEKHAEHSSAPQALYNAAFASMELKKFKAGLAFTQDFIDKFESDSFLPDVKYVRGECFLLSNQYPQAETVFKDLVDKHATEDSIQSWQVRYGLTLYLQDKYDQTIEYLSTVQKDMDQPGTQAETGFLMGASQFYLKKFSAAVTSLEKATAFGQTLKQIDEGLVLLAQAYAESKDYKKALTALDNLTSNYAASRYASQGNYLSGQYLSFESSFDKAIAKYDVVIDGKKTKYTPFALYGKGWALLNLQKNEESITEFDTIIESYKGHKLEPDAYYSRAVANRRTKKYQETIADIEKCLELDEDFSNKVSALYEKGMAESAAAKYSSATKTFEVLVSDYADNKDADEFLYQLAWAHKFDKKVDESVKHFQQLTTRFPDSQLASEAHYHVAESFYVAKKYEQAIAEYTKASAKAKSPEVGEKSKYKLAWSHYQKGDFDQARQAFDDQLQSFKQGDLSDSGKFMVAECYYQLDEFAEADKQFGIVKETVLSSKKTSPVEKALLCLHAAESANKIRKYDVAKEYVRTLQDDLQDKDYVAEGWLELGNAQRGLKELADARDSFTKAFDQTNSETGARAGFLVGEVLFGQKKFDDAIRQYKLVIYGYGGTRAPDNIKKWQCSSGYETARCYHVQIKNESDSSKRQKLIDEAKKFYNYVVQNHAGDRLAIESKKQLAVLSKL